MTTMHRWRMATTLAIGAALVLAGCGGGSDKSSTANAGGTSTSGVTSTTAASAAPGTAFRVAQVAGVGAVVVDARGRTVYALTADGHTNAPCEDSTGCTKAWPDLSLPDGTEAATAGTGLQAGLLATKQANGETYPTYSGWLLYEFSGDSAAGQAHGQGIKSFGGTWYAVTATGTLATMAAAPRSTTTTTTCLYPPCS
jgi:predicted lipoprotein with Yx(FWY)xxD motif